MIEAMKSFWGSVIYSLQTENVWDAFIEKKKKKRKKEKQLPKIYILGNNLLNKWKNKVENGGNGFYTDTWELILTNPYL